LTILVLRRERSVRNLTMMRLSILALVLAPGHGFTTVHTPGSRPFVALAATKKGADPEVSRRVALVTAAALAAGASPAYAASLEKTVTSIEKENVSEVNTKGAPEKHLPQVTLAGTTVEVVVPHVMDPEKPHFIEYVWLKDLKSGKVVAVQSFAATDASPPTLTASVESGTTVKPLLYCNLHGLWEGESLTV
jgi:desulfoferrodoxin (superoxide reductase-like protein)